MYKICIPCYWYISCLLQITIRLQRALSSLLRNRIQSFYSIFPSLVAAWLLHAFGRSFVFKFAPMSQFQRNSCCLTKYQRFTILCSRMFLCNKTEEISTKRNAKCELRVASISSVLTFQLHWFLSFFKNSSDEMFCVSYLNDENLMFR